MSTKEEKIEGDDFFLESVTTVATMEGLEIFVIIVKIKASFLKIWIKMKEKRRGKVTGRGKLKRKTRRKIKI